MQVNNLNFQLSVPREGLIRKFVTLFGGPNRTDSTVDAVTIQHEEIEPPIYVTAVGRGNCFVWINYKGKSMEAIDAAFGTGAGKILKVGDEVIIGSYRSSWPVVRKVC